MRPVNVALVRLCFCASAAFRGEIDPDGLATEPRERLSQPADAAAEIERGTGVEGAEKCRMRSYKAPISPSPLRKKSARAWSGSDAAMKTRIGQHAGKGILLTDDLPVEVGVPHPPGTTCSPGCLAGAFRHAVRPKFLPEKGNT